MITVEVKDEAVHAALQRLIAKAGNARPALEDIGEYLLVSTKERFFTKTAPDGSQWQPNSSLTRRLKGRNDPLVGESESLKTQLHYNAGSNRLEFGSSMEYAAMQHFGGTTSPRSRYPNAAIPARPYLGLSDEDRRNVLDILQEHLELP